MVGLKNIFGDILDKADAKYPISFPSIVRGNTLCIAADFSGQDKGQHYEVYSFLVFDLDHAGHWMTTRANLRTSVSIGVIRFGGLRVWCFTAMVLFV